ncbi:hypothetical protein [Enterobacter hormaechei]|uniref:hypothetical protein n=1 Tax=Enterobacter hormaechei TaxID=158836 RepID=UPI00254C0449|nr:hypothetical protein [Enterobacter hormaechei]MDK9634577.1 hypothetical protein [Enterobacter hormaechei]
MNAKYLMVGGLLLMVSGCGDVGGDSINVAKQVVSKQYPATAVITFKSASYYPKKDGEGMVCGEFSNNGGTSRFIVATVPQNESIKATTPFIENAGTSTETISLLWNSECK